MDEHKEQHNDASDSHMPDNQEFTPGQTEPVTTGTPQTIQKPRKKSHKILALVVGAGFLLLLALAGIAAYYYYKPSAPAEKQTLNFMRTEDAVRAYTLDMIAKAKSLKDGTGTQEKLAKELNEVATVRRDALLDLLHENTSSFLTLVQPDGFTKDLPADVASKTERTKKISGKLEVAIADPYDGISGKNPKAAEKYYYNVVDSTGKRSAIYFDKDVEDKFYNRKVTVNALELSGEYGAQADAITTTDTSTSNSNEPLLTTGTTVNKRVAVILMNFKSDTSQPWSKSAVANTFAGGSGSANSYYNEVTYGGLTVSADAFGYYTVDADTTKCDYYQTWADLARQQAVAAGVNLDAYDHVSYVWPSQSSCYWAGMGSIAGKNTWINGYGTNLLVVGHEFGHNLGLQHAQSAYCTENGTVVTMSNNCSYSEYGDPYDIMGNSNAIRHIMTMRKAYLKAINPNSIITASSGEFTIAPLEKATAETQVVRIPRDYDAYGKVLNYYYIDYRQPSGYDSFTAGSNIVSGVTVHVGGEYTNINKTQLLDMTPGSTANNNDPALTAGNEFFDKTRNIRIVTKSASSTGATISINGTTGATCVRSAPSVVAQPTSQWTSAGGTLSYSLTITSKDSSVCPESSFTVAPVLPTGFTHRTTPYTSTLTPGASATVLVAVTSPTTTVGGSYNIPVNAVNAYSAGLTTTVNLGYNVYDQTVAPPTVTISKPLANSTLSGRGDFAATATSTNGITKMELYINQRLVASTNSGSISYTLNNKKTKLSGTLPVTVMAYDTQNAIGSSTIYVKFQ